jgi:drug/metabolite transporter (DMT)-like permease
MSVAPPPPRPPVAVAPGRRPSAPVGEKVNCTAAWALVGVLLAFKAVTITLIIVVAYPGENLVPMVIAMNWPWLIVLGVLLSVIPFGFWFRLARARAKRRRLQRAEWRVD